MSDIQEDLKQQLLEQTERVVARGGPAAVRAAGRFILHYEPLEAWRYEAARVQPREYETYYPLAAVMAALGYSCLPTLQQDWNEALGQPGPLPLYLHPTAAGHYTAMLAETVVLDHLIWLTDACDAVMMAD